MNETEYNQLIEAGWRRPLTPAEAAAAQEYLATRPEAEAAFAEEAALSQCLRLPDVPLPSNFTAQVLQALDRETSAPKTGWSWRSFLSRHWFPRLASGAAALALTAAGLQYYQAGEHARLMSNARMFATVAADVSQEMHEDVDPSALVSALKNFEAVRCLPAGKPQADTDLLTLLQ